MPTASTVRKDDLPVATVEKRPSAAHEAPPAGRKALDSLGDLPPSDDDVFDEEDQLAPAARMPEAAPAATLAAKKGRKGRSSKPREGDGRERGDGSLRITPATYEGIAGEDGVTTEYWVGTTGDSVIQNIDVLGICFPRFVGTCSFDDKGVPDRPTKNGQLLQLTEAKVQSVLEAIGHRVLRRLGRGRGQVFDMRDGSYRPMPNLDRPLGSVLYMVRTQDLSFELGARNTYPTPLVSPED